ncbi:MAG: c-type cytochrome [Nitrospiria bacterium]
MSQARVIIIMMAIVIIFGAIVHFTTKAVIPEKMGSDMISLDMSRPRAPSESRKVKNPILVSEKVIQEGREAYLGKGGCVVCHGKEARGDGPGGTQLSPPPRDLTDPNFHLLRTDGEMFWSIKHGVEGSGMFKYVPRMLSEEEAWKVIHYIRTLKRKRT